MFKPKSSEKGVVLLIVLGTILIVVILAGVLLRVISNQSRLTHHQVSRIKAYYAARGVMNYTQEMLRRGDWVADATVTKHACLGDCAGLGVSSPEYNIPTDSDIKYNILVTIYPLNTADNATLNSQVTQLNIKTDYSYTP